jgi:hypothetical protein
MVVVGEMELPEFIQVMTTTLTQRAAKATEEMQGSKEDRTSVQQAVLPFELTATAYRR